MATVSLGFVRKAAAAAKVVRTVKVTVTVSGSDRWDDDDGRGSQGHDFSITLKG